MFEDFSTPHSAMDILSIKKLKRKTLELIYDVEQTELTKSIEYSS